jgi:Tfp pilus assembly protein PilN
MSALSLAGWWGWESQSLQDAAERYEAAAARAISLNESFAAQMQRDGLILTPDQIAVARTDVVFANQLADKRSFSWTRLLSDLEETVPPEVSIASIKLNFQESAVVLEGMARRLQDLDRFVHQLQQHRAFRQAVLSKHELRQEAAGKPGLTAGQPATSSEVETERFIEYSLTVLYRPTL